MAQKLLKKLISPMQQVLLQRGLCPACTRRLEDIKNRDPRPNNTVRIQCECNRIYILEVETNTYRRAMMSEV